MKYDDRSELSYPSHNTRRYLGHHLKVMVFEQVGMCGAQESSISLAAAASSISGAFGLAGRRA